MLGACDKAKAVDLSNPYEAYETCSLLVKFYDDVVAHLAPKSIFG